MKLAAALLAACAAVVPLAAAKSERAGLHFRVFATGVRGVWWIGAPHTRHSGGQLQFGP